MRNFFFSRSLKSKKKKLELTLFYYLSQETRKMVGQFKKSLFEETNQGPTFCHTRESSKMFNIT